MNIWRNLVKKNVDRHLVREKDFVDKKKVQHYLKLKKHIIIALNLDELIRLGKYYVMQFVCFCRMQKTEELYLFNKNFGCNDRVKVDKIKDLFAFFLTIQTALLAGTINFKVVMRASELDFENEISTFKNDETAIL